MTFDPDQYLREVGGQADEDIDLARVALALALVTARDVSAEKYFNHIEKLCEEVERFHEGALVEAGDTDSAALRLESLRSVLYERYGYEGDVEDYDHIQNASLLRLIDRGKGMPITLGILYIHVGRALGWALEGLNVPGHFLCRIDYESERILFDAFNGCKALGAPDIRFIVKQALGAEAEISASYYEPCSNREILIRLQNNIKLRKIEAEDYAGALEVVQWLQVIDPQEYRLCLDAGVLYARNQQPRLAVENLERYIDEAPDANDRHDAALLLQHIRTELH